jgi:uncharacterized protein YkwD
MNLKKSLNVAGSILIFGIFLGIMVLLFAASTGIPSIDTEPDPVTNAEPNTTGVPIVNASDYSGIDGKELERAIFEEVNDQRRSYDRKPFVHSERVRLIARLHSKDMAERDFFDHENPEGESVAARHIQYDGCERPNENIYRWSGFSTNDTMKIANSIALSWENSSGHNQTQLSESYHVSGVGVYVTEDREIYATQNFCREHPNA